MTEKRKVQLKGYDEIFSTEESRKEEALGKIRDIPVNELYPFKDHPFRVVDDESMLRTVESVATYGVISPLIVRPRPEGGYEILSGHRRKHAAELAGLSTLPVIVKDLDDDAATILMVDSNLQRETILPSERAWAYRMKMDAMKHQGERTDLTLGQVVPKFARTTEAIAEGTGQSYKQVERYIRLTHLLPDFIEMVDSGKLAFNTAVELSYLTDQEQFYVLDAIDYSQNIPSLSQAQQFKKASQEGTLTSETANATMLRDKKPTLDKFSFKGEKFRKFFPKNYTQDQMEAVIIKLLKKWQLQHSHSQEL